MTIILVCSNLESKKKFLNLKLLSLDHLLSGHNNIIIVNNGDSNSYDNNKNN